MTNNEMLMAAIEFQEEMFALDLMYLIQNGIVNSEDEFKNTPWNSVDRKVVNEWKKCNLLGIDKINLYAARIDVSDWMIILSTTEEEARGHAFKELRRVCNVIKMPKEKMLQSFWFPDSNTYKSLLDIKKESNSFPKTAIII